MPKFYMIFDKKYNFSELWWEMPHLLCLWTEQDGDK